MGLISVLRSALLILPLPFLLKRFQYCRSHVLAHAYCLHLEIMKLACSSIIVNHVYGLFVVACTVGVDSLIIFLSYALILLFSSVIFYLLMFLPSLFNLHLPQPSLVFFPSESFLFSAD